MTLLLGKNPSRKCPDPPTLPIWQGRVSKLQSIAQFAISCAEPPLQLLEIAWRWWDGVDGRGAVCTTLPAWGHMRLVLGQAPRFSAATSSHHSDGGVRFDSSASNCFNRSSASSTSCMNTVFCSTALAIKSYTLVTRFRARSKKFRQDVNLSLTGGTRDFALAAFNASTRGFA